jgi:NTP-dependent ternary system trypsin peptidase co-occuring protein
MAEPQIPLADAIKALRAQLADAMAEGEGKALRFQVREVELELQLELATETGGNLSVAWIVSVGAKAGTTSRTTHTVRLTLAPEASSGGGIKLGSGSEPRPK